MASKPVTATASLYTAEKTQRSYVMVKLDGAPYSPGRDVMIANHKETLEAAAAELLRMAKNAPATIATPVKAAGKNAGTACACGGSIPQAAKFCPGCGSAAPTAAHCTHCSTVLVPGAKFCAGCGKPAAGPTNLSAPVVTATNGTVSVDAAV